MRGAALLAVLVVSGPAPVAAEDPGAGLIGVRAVEPVGHYGHDVMGPGREWAALELRFDLCPACANLRVREVVQRLPEGRIVEGADPRLADLDGDRHPEVIFVETDPARGARLSVRGPEGPIASTDYIGTPHRWLAPSGVADLDGDGRVEIAYVDRPHLARVLRVVRLEGDRLVEVAALPGVTNHRFGAAEIGGGIRDCGQGPEIVVASGDWSRLLAVRLEGGALVPRDLGAFDGFTEALACR